MLFILPIEPLPERYTEQWVRWFEKELEARGIERTWIYGTPLTDKVETGTVLDAEGTNYYKFSQLLAVVRLFKDKKVPPGSKFFVMDLWFPGLEAIPYMATLEKIPIEIYGFMHAGSYIKEDFAQPMEKWAQHHERGWIAACAKVFVGSLHHRYLLMRMERSRQFNRIVATGCPFDTLEIGKGTDTRKNVVAFTHRFDAEKRPDVFLKMVQDVWVYRQDFEVWITTSRESVRGSASDALLELVRLQDKMPIKIFAGLTKKEYYALLLQVKVFVSTTVEETFGYCLLEAMTAGCHPVVEKKFSHPELLAGASEFMYSTFDEAVRMISSALDVPQSARAHAARYNTSVGRILDEMGL